MKHIWKIATTALAIVCAALCVRLLHQYDRLVRLESEVAALNAQLWSVQADVSDLKYDLREANTRISDQIGRAHV